MGRPHLDHGRSKGQNRRPRSDLPVQPFLQDLRPRRGHQPDPRRRQRVGHRRQR